MVTEMDLPVISWGLSATTHTSTVGVPSAALKNCALRCRSSGKTTDEEEVVYVFFKYIIHRYKSEKEQKRFDNTNYNPGREIW